MIRKAEFDGNDVAGFVDLRATWLIFDPNRVTLVYQNLPQSPAAYRVNRNVNPNQIDIDFRDSNGRLSRWKGIYQVNQDVCWLSLNELYRPQAFQSSRGSKGVACILQRVAK